MEIKGKRKRGWRRGGREEQTQREEVNAAARDKMFT